MEKCWLIRTKNKQILGPVTKQKIIEFIDKGSLTPEDEVTSGNGYWILIKENNLIDKYVRGDIPQGFNPISEAPNVLTANLSQPTENTGSLNPNTMPKDSPPPAIELDLDESPAVPEGGDLDYPDMGGSAEPAGDDQVATPSNEDLEYPDMGMVESNPTPVSKPAVSTPPKNPPVQMNAHVEAQEPGHDEEGKMPCGDDLEYPDMGGPVSAAAPVEQEEFDPDATDPSFDMNSVQDSSGEIVFSEPPLVKEDVTPELPEAAFEEPVKKKANVASSQKKSSKKKASPDKKRKVKKKNKPQRNDRYLFYVLVLLIGIIASGAYYYFTNILNSEVVRIGNPFIQSVNAQAQFSNDLKKKVSLKYLP
ncbi:putative membrane protein [Halobacteriovorax marinus SJ]|uniref:Membrane protein n=1 Tax=Halobacteriovorax marinus (strain ATCC BAA-682 / DSM 15412 / SJ) TaxID=862908 RepID=E1WY01_HALMS|nr:hypothetical protein [Halobacteriovorax marinus]CBW27556.1 putative membrane protein [Halobacteriovorax marinus SJ]